MRKLKIALKLGHLLAMMAIFLAAVGMHLIHPAVHHSMPTCADRAGDSPQHRAQLSLTGSHTHIQSYDQCPICLFLSKFHSQVSSSEPSVVALDYASKDLVAFEFVILQKSCGLALGSRAPPQLPSLRV